MDFEGSFYASQMFIRRMASFKGHDSILDRRSFVGVHTPDQDNPNLERS